MKNTRRKSIALGIVLLLALAAAPPPASAPAADFPVMYTFSGCGEIVFLPFAGCKGFAADSGTLYITNLTGFEVGDRVHVSGQVDMECLTACYYACIPESAIELCPTAPGDFNGDGVINVFDLLYVLANWGPCEVAYNCPADLNKDEVVNVFDLLQILSSWG